MAVFISLDCGPHLKIGASCVDFGQPVVHPRPIKANVDRTEIGYLKLRLGSNQSVLGLVSSEPTRVASPPEIPIYLQPEHSPARAERLNLGGN